VELPNNAIQIEILRVLKGDVGINDDMIQQLFSGGRNVVVLALPHHFLLVDFNCPSYQCNASSIFYPFFLVDLSKALPPFFILSSL